MKDFYKTRLVLEVEITTQFGPQDAIHLIQNNLKCPAVKNIILKEVSSDYVPLTEKDANYKVLKDVPRIL